MDQEVFFTNIRNEIISNLRTCKLELKIAVAWFTDKTLINEVNQLIDNGVKVDIIIYDDHINQKQLFKELYYNKAKIHLSKNLMHNKFCIIDNKTVINGSYNWTMNAALNEENIQVTYNDDELVKQFTKQFEKIASICKTIDDHFEYSLSNLEAIEFEYKRFYSTWPKYSFPYFLDTRTVSHSKENWASRQIFGHIYFIKNQEDENSFLWYFYFLRTKYSINKLLRIKNEKIHLPAKLNFVYDIKFDINGVAEFAQIKKDFNYFQNKFTETTPTSYVVEIQDIKKYNKRYYIYSINKEGNPSSEQYSFTHKVKEGLYLMDRIIYPFKNPYFINHQLVQTFIQYEIDYVLPSYDMIVKNIAAKYGLLDSNNKLIIATKFDFRQIYLTEGYIDLIEFPKFEIVRSSGYLGEPNSYSGYRYLDYDHIIHRYSISNFSFLGRIKIKGEKNKNNSDYLFSSDSDYRYETFYEKIKNFSPKINVESLNKGYIPAHHLKVTQTELINQPLRLFEFDRLMHEFDNNNDLAEVLKAVIRGRVKEQFAREVEIEKSKKKKEGCYVATMVYKDYNHPDVIVLRNFRDTKLTSNIVGVRFINFYYAYSPTFVEMAKTNTIFYWLSEKIIYILVLAIKKHYSKNVYNTHKL